MLGKPISRHSWNGGLIPFAEYEELVRDVPSAKRQAVTAGQNPTLDELENRIQRDVSHFNGSMPELLAIAWYVYRAALIEWGLISISDDGRLCDMLPRVEDNPATAILLGRATTSN